MPELVLPERVDVEEGDTMSKPAPSRSTTMPPPAFSRTSSALELSHGGTPPIGATNTNGAAGGAGAGAVFAGFGAVDKTSTTTKPNPFGGPTTTKPNSHAARSATLPNPFGSNNPFGTSQANAFGGKSGAGSGFGAGASAFGAGASAFGASSSALGEKSSTTPSATTLTNATAAFGTGAGAFETKAVESAGLPKPSGSPLTSKLSPFAANFVPRFALPGAAAAPQVPQAPQVSRVPAPLVLGSASAPAPAPAPPALAPVAPPEVDTQAEAAKAAKEAKLREKLEAARREEVRLRAEEQRKAKEKQTLEEQEQLFKLQEEQQAEKKQQAKQRAAEEQAKREAELQRQAAERERLLHSVTAELLLADILEILVVPEVQYVVARKREDLKLLALYFAWWKERAAKRVKRRRVLENMGLGRVGVAGAAEEVGELFDAEDEDEDLDTVVRKKRRTASLREDRNDAELAAAIAKVRMTLSMCPDC